MARTLGLGGNGIIKLEKAFSVGASDDFKIGFYMENLVFNTSWLRMFTGFHEEDARPSISMPRNTMTAAFKTDQNDYSVQFPDPDTTIYTSVEIERVSGTLTVSVNGSAISGTPITNNTDTLTGIRIINMVGGTINAAHYDLKSLEFYRNGELCQKYTANTPKTTWSGGGWRFI